MNAGLEGPWVHVTGSVSRLAGGMFESVSHLTRSVQQASGAEVIVMGLEEKGCGEDLECWAPMEVRRHRVLGPRVLGYSPQLGQELRGMEPSLVHLHGLWKYSSWAVRRWSSRESRPYVVSPHGMLEPWALGQGGWKKRLALRCYAGRCLREAACLRATSAAEAGSIRRAGFGNPIAVVPNGVNCPEQLQSGAPDRGGKGRALFLSRIHPKKGLLNLLRAWAAVRPAQWELRVVGPDEGGHLAEAQALGRRLGLGEEVIFAGAAWGQARTDLLLATDLMVLPSFSENFGLVIAEALAHGVPVITTRATPWSEVQERACGWWIETGVEPLMEALRAASSLPRDQLREMGQRGRDLVKREYSWTPIGQKMVAVYEWILKRRVRPDYVLDPGDG